MLCKQTNYLWSPKRKPPLTINPKPRKGSQKPEREVEIHFRSVRQFYYQEISNIIHCDFSMCTDKKMQSCAVPFKKATPVPTPPSTIVAAIILYDKMPRMFPGTRVHYTDLWDFSLDY